MRVLVVEDFEVLATAIGSGLRREGMAVDVALDGADALAHLALTRYDVVVARREDAERRGIEVSTALSAAAAKGDPRLVESLVVNLVDNAIRYSVTGGRVTVSTVRAAGQATLRVTNTGPQVPPDQVERLFQSFQRLGGERTRNIGGHGLGLAIVRAIAAAHGAALTGRALPEGGLDIEVSFPGKPVSKLTGAVAAPAGQ